MDHRLQVQVYENPEPSTIQTASTYAFYVKDLCLALPTCTQNTRWRELHTWVVIFAWIGGFLFEVTIHVRRVKN